ncbi:WhiB family transcriptional regulator [Streptomyces sclerotialus]|uniref:WhiB family transcriptional regulator n=1 Tax=Streptomyces sclerotialus TaxID=1957 RepID=UPI0034A52E1A
MREFNALASAAREMCASCPLWAECLRDAVVHADPYGYAAATTADDRRWIRRELGIGDAEGRLPSGDGDHGSLNELVVEQRRHPGASQREMAVRLGCSRSTVSRRLARVRSRMEDDALGRCHPDADVPELEAILDAFDALQDHLAKGQGIAVRVGRGSGRAKRTAPGSGAAGRSAPGRPTGGQAAAERPTSPLQLHDVNGGAMADGDEQRILFSYADPAAAVRKAMLWPLVRAAAPALAGAEQLVAMLIAVPGSGVTPETLAGIRQARPAVESLLSDADESAPRAEDVLQGSVSVELAMQNPVAALQKAFLEPLLHSVVDSLTNIETVGLMLAAVPGAKAVPVDFEAIRSARRALKAQLAENGTEGVGTAENAARPAAHDDAVSPTVPENRSGRPVLGRVPRQQRSTSGPMIGHGVPAGPDSPAVPRRPRSVPTSRPISIRAAVEQAVSTIAEPFTGKDVADEVAARRASGSPATARDSGKAVSNVLSAMVKSGRLRRLSRGTYVRAQGAAEGSGAAGVPDTPET